MRQSVRTIIGGVAASFVFLAMNMAPPAQASAFTEAGVASAAADGGKKKHHEDDGPRPFDENRSAMMDVDAALAAAAINGKRVLLILGGNWCHDSRGLAGKLETRVLAKLIEENFELVYVDVGHRDRNLDVPKRFGVDTLLGTPTILILSADGQLLNAESVHDWRDADSRSLEETDAYFRSFTAP